MIAKLYSWFANFSNYLIPYASTLLVRALVYIVFMLLLTALFLVFRKMSQSKRNHLLLNQAAENNPERKTDRSKKHVIRNYILASIVLLLVVLLIGTTRMTNFGKLLFQDNSTQTIVKGNFNWIELDSENRLLYVVGHGTNQIMAFHTDHLNDPPFLSEPVDEKAQSIAFNKLSNEIYYPTKTEIIIFSVPDLRIKGKIEIPPLSPGDVWILWDERNEQIILSSEADENTDHCFLVVDRKTGDVVSDMPLNAWNVYLHPDQSILYVGPRFSEKLYYMYDTTTHKVGDGFETGELGDRMILDRNRNELLIAAPSKSRISRYDPMTFEYLGSMQANWGVRSLAIDQERNLLFAGSLVDNMVIMIDLDTFKTVRRCWVGPWIRSIVLDTENCLAYVSTKYDLVRIAY